MALGLTFSLHAQNTIPASGGEASGNNGSTSYTVGQLFYSLHTGTNGSVAEGVQQPFEISVVVGIDNARAIALNCKAYPNPAIDLLTLEVDKLDDKDLYYQLCDAAGKILVSKKIIEIRTLIPMEELSPSTYFLKITDNKTSVKVFKIVKTQ
jgi:hypothetical protein